MKAIRATFSHGVFKPLEKVEYPEGKEITLMIPDRAVEEIEQEEARQYIMKFIKETHEHNKDVDPEVLEKEITEAVEAVKKQELKEMVSKV